MAPTPPKGALPAYLRIAEHLTREIGAGRLAPGDRLAPERQMAARFGVSMVTLRKALRVVTERGLLDRRQGAGNFVRAPRERDLGTYALFRLEPLGDLGALPTAEVIGFEVKEAPPPLPGLGPLPRAYRIRRIRALGGRAVAAEEIWLDARFGDLRRDMLSESLYRTYATRLGLTIAHAEDRLSTGALPDWAEGRLDGLDPAHRGAPMLLVERTGFDQYGAPAEISRTWVDTGRARYYARVP